MAKKNNKSNSGANTISFGEYKKKKDKKETTIKYSDFKELRKQKEYEREQAEAKTKYWQDVSRNARYSNDGEDNSWVAYARKQIEDTPGAYERELEKERKAREEYNRKVKEQSEARTKAWQDATKDARYSSDGIDKSWEIYALKQIRDTPGAYERELKKQEEEERRRANEEALKELPDMANSAAKNALNRNALTGRSTGKTTGGTQTTIGKTDKGVSVRKTDSGEDLLKSRTDETLRNIGGGANGYDGYVPYSTGKSITPDSWKNIQGKNTKADTGKAADTHGIVLNDKKDDLQKLQDKYGAPDFRANVKGIDARATVGQGKSGTKDPVKARTDELLKRNLLEGNEKTLLNQNISGKNTYALPKKQDMSNLNLIDAKQALQRELPGSTNSIYDPKTYMDMSPQGIMERSRQDREKRYTSETKKSLFEQIFGPGDGWKEALGKVYNPDYEGYKEYSRDQGFDQLTVEGYNKYNQRQEEQRKAGAYDNGANEYRMSDRGLMEHGIYAKSMAEQREREKAELEQEKAKATEGWYPTEAMEGVSSVYQDLKNWGLGNIVYGAEKGAVDRAKEWYNSGHKLTEGDDPDTQARNREIVFDYVYGDSSDYDRNYEYVSENLSTEEKKRLDEKLDNIISLMVNPNKSSEEYENDIYAKEREMELWQKEVKEVEAEQENRATLSKLWDMVGGVTASPTYDPSLIPQQYSGENQEAWKYIHIKGTPIEQSYFWMNNKNLLFTRDYDHDNLSLLKKEFFVTDEEREAFNKLFADDKVNGTNNAQAFLDGIDPYLKSRQSEYEDFAIRQHAEHPIGGLIDRIATLPANAVGGIVGSVGAMAGLFGNESAQDPNSGWYKLTKYTQSVRDQRNKNAGKAVVDTISGWIKDDKAREDFRKWAEGKPEFLLNVLDSVADNLFAMAVSGGLSNAEGASRASMALIQMIMSGEATSSTMLKNLESNMDPTEAAIRAVGSGIIEAITERYSLEVLLSPRASDIVGNIPKYLAKVAAAEGSEEIAADLMNMGFDSVMSTLYDHMDEIEAEVAQLMSDGETSYKDALKQAWERKLIETGLSGLAGAMSGGLLGIGRVIMNTKVSSKMGNDIRQGNQFRGETGTEQILKLGAGMKENTQSEKYAKTLQKQGKTPSNYQIGKLAQMIQLDTGEQQQAAVKDIVRKTIQEQLAAKGVEGPMLGTYADIMTENLMEHESLTREQNRILGQNDAAFELWQTFKQAGAQETNQLKEAIRGATLPTRTVMNDLNEIIDKRRAHSVASNYVKEAIKKTRTDAEAIDYMVANHSNMLSEDMAETAKTLIAKDARAQQSGTAVDDVMKIVLAANTLNDIMPRTNLSEETAQKVFEAAKAEFEENDNLRIQNNVKLQPGQGKADFEGAEAGTEEWNEKIKQLKNPKQREHVRLLSAAVSSMGMNVHFVNMEDETYKHGYEIAETGEIVINVASDMDHAMLITIGHEGTHWLEHNSPDGYKVLRRFNVDGLRANGQNVEQLLMQTIENQEYARALERASGKKQTIESLDMNGALAEIVAKSCENLFTSETMARKLENTDPSLFGKMKSYVKNFVTRWRAAIEDVPQLQVSREAKMLYRQTEQIAKIWLQADDDARTNKDVDSFNRSTENGLSIQHSLAGPEANGEYGARVRRAQEMAKNGYSDEQIKQETGAVRGYKDNFWIQLDNSRITMKEDALQPDSSDVKLGDILEAEELFDAYPRIRNINVRIGVEEEDCIAVYDTGTGEVVINPEFFNRSKEEQDEIIRHEIQHIIQQIERRNNGTTTSAWKEVQDVYYGWFELFSGQKANIESKYGVMIMLDENGDFDTDWMTPADIEKAKKMSAMELNKIKNYFDLYNNYRNVIQSEPFELYWNTVGELEARSAQKISDNQIPDYSNAIAKEDFLDRFGNTKAPNFSNKGPKSIFGSSMQNTRGVDAKAYAADPVGYAVKNPGRQFSMATPVEMRDDNLVAIHNMDINNLRKAMNLGAIVSPSIGVMNHNRQWTYYGDISLFFGREVVDPAIEGNVTYSGDAYTPTLTGGNFETKEDALAYIRSKPARRIGNATTLSDMIMEFRKMNSLDAIRKNANKETGKIKSYIGTYTEETEQKEEALWNTIVKDAQRQSRYLYKEYFEKPVMNGILYGTEAIERMTNPSRADMREVMREALNNQWRITKKVSDNTLGFEMSKLKNRTIDAMVNFALDTIESNQSTMQEAKPDKNIPFSQLKAIEMPDSVDEAVVDKLVNELGVSEDAIYRYDPDAESGPRSRLEVMKGIQNTREGVQFSTEQNNSGYRDDGIDISDVLKNRGKYKGYFTYENLIRKKPIIISDIGDENNNKTRSETVINAIENVKKIGGEKNGKAYVHVDDTNSNVFVDKSSIRHSLDRRTSQTLMEHIGKILKNSIAINAADPREPGQVGAYMLLGAARSNQGLIYVSFNVNRNTNELGEIDVLYSTRKKNEAAGLMPRGSAVSGITLTASTVSIADALDEVKNSFANILPVDVLDHFGVQRRITKDTQYLHYSVADMGTQETEADTSDKQYSVKDMMARSWDEQVNLVEQHRAKTDDVMVINQDGELSEFGMDGMITIDQTAYHMARSSLMRGEPGLSKTTMRRLPAALRNPLARIESSERRNILITALKDNDRPVAVGLYKTTIDDQEVWKAWSVFGSKNITRLFGRNTEGKFVPNENTKIYLYDKSARDVLLTGAEQYGADVKDAIDKLSDEKAEVKPKGIADQETREYLRSRAQGHINQNNEARNLIYEKYGIGENDIMFGIEFTEDGKVDYAAHDDAEKKLIRKIRKADLKTLYELRQDTEKWMKARDGEEDLNVADYLEAKDFAAGRNVNLKPGSLLVQEKYGAKVKRYGGVEHQYAGLDRDSYRLQPEDDGQGKRSYSFRTPLGMDTEKNALYKSYYKEGDNWYAKDRDGNTKKLEGLDKEYVIAWKNGDTARMEEILMDKIRTEGAIPFKAATSYNNVDHAWISNEIKTGNMNAIKRAAAEMAELVPQNAVLIPMPPHTGKVTDETDTMVLANAISSITGNTVINALEGNEREQRKTDKNKPKSKQMTAEDLGFRQVAEIPEGAIPYFIDNVIASGVTAKAAHDAFGGGLTLAYSKSTRTAIEGLKRATPTFYDTSKPYGDWLIPLDERIDMSKKGYAGTRFSVEQQAERKEVSEQIGKIKESRQFSVTRPVEVKGQLIAVHNMTKQNLLDTLNEEGITAPSIAVIKAAMGHSKFGEISVIFKKDAIDPRKDSRNKVYGADAWTPTRQNARIETKLNTDVLYRARETLQNLLKEGKANLWANTADTWVNRWLYEDQTTDTEDDMIEKAYYNDGMVVAYETAKGREIQEKTRAVKVYDDLQESMTGLYNEFLDRLEEEGKLQEFMEEFESLSGAEIINRYKDIFGNSGELGAKIVKAAERGGMAGYRLTRNMMEAKLYQQEGRQIRTTEELDKGATAEAIRNSMDREDFNGWVRSLIDGVLGQKGVYNGRDPFTPSGNRRTFEQLHMEPTAENIVKAMYTNHEAKGGEAGGATGLMAKSSKEYRSLSDIRKDAGRLRMLDEDEYSARIEELDAKIDDFAERIRDSIGLDYYTFKQELIEAGGEYAKGGEAAVRRYFRQENEELTEEQIQEAIGLMDEAREMPTGYFEAKPERVMNFDEIYEVIMPEDAELQAALDERGIPYETTDGTEEDRKAKLNGHPDVRFSVETPPDMDVNRFMLGLNELHMNTVQERSMLRQFKDLRMTIDMTRMKMDERNRKLTALEAKPNPSVYDREEMRKLRNLQMNDDFKMNRLQSELGRITSSEGYAGIMYRQSRMMNDLVTGRTAEELNGTVRAMNSELDHVSQEMAEREERLKKLAESEAVLRVRTQFNRSGLKSIAAKLKSDMASTLSNEIIENRLALIALKMKEGQFDQENTVELADMIVGKMTKTYDSYILDELRGRTIVLSDSQMKELRGQKRTLAEIRKELSGTGIRIQSKGNSTLDMEWSELCDLIPSLDRDATDKDMLDNLLDVIRSEKRMSTAVWGADENQMEICTKVLEAARDLIPEIVTDEKSLKLIRETLSYVQEMSAEARGAAEAVGDIGNLIKNLQKKGTEVSRTAGTLGDNVQDAIQYFNQLGEQSEAALWKRERVKLIEQLKSENTQNILAEQAKWKEKIAKDNKARDMQRTNMQLRKAITTNYSRIRKLLINETDQKNVPEHMKGLAREMIGMIAANDVNGRKISGIMRNDLFDTLRVLDAMKEQDGEFSPDDLRLIGDEEAQAAVADALADLEEGIQAYNGSPTGNLITNLQGYHDALDKIAEAVATITGVINAERSISFRDRQIPIEDAASLIRLDMRQSRFKGELVGKNSKKINALRNIVVSGNMTPVYFFKNLKNRGMMEQWREMEAGENQSGIETQKAKDYLGALAERTGYKNWANDKKEVTLGGRRMTISVENMMELFAIWKREQTTNPEMSEHLKKGGVFFQTDEQEEGKLRREKQDMRAVRVTDAEVMEVFNQLTPEQQEYLDGIVSYLSNDMSALGNEASMRMYGIKKYKESYYFPMKVWDGVKSARSDRGISGTDENWAAHRSWSKRRQNMARNALVIGNFTQDAVKHIVEMINYNTLAPAIENINKVLNYKFEEGDNQDESTKRNLRVMFQESYGRDALKYLEDYMKDMNGGPAQDQRKTVRDAMISVFKKNAVAGSLSVAFQQPLSYIRAAMMISPKYLAQAISPRYWKGSAAEMKKYSGVAVIKDMGRFDMNFGQSAKDYITPETKQSVYSRVIDKLTIGPELMDLMTWTRMWSAVKVEQKALHPEMDPASDEFLKTVATRFNEVMRRTQVYDSILVKSSNMRNQNGLAKIATAFMAEPTLSLNVLADAVKNAGEKGGKENLAKAVGTFLLSAICQAAVKGVMSTGRSPDDKKTLLENFMNRWMSSFLSEVDPFGLIPGYSDLMEVLKTGELSDNAMSTIGKLYSVGQSIAKAADGKGKGWYRDVEDTAGQLVQLFTNIPAKNLMRDARAMYTWFSGDKYAARETSTAVLKHQAIENVFGADNLLGVVNTWLGKAGYKTDNKAYYRRIYQAMSGDNQQEADDIREYLLLGKGVKAENINEGVKDAMLEDESLDDVEQSEWLIDNGMMSKVSDITTKYKKYKISREEASSLMRKLDPDITDDEIWWTLDRTEYQRDTGAEKVSGYYYRLTDAVNANKAEDINKVVKDLMAHGITKEKIKSKLSDWKSEYLAADSKGKIRIRDAITKAYKAAGYTVEDAEKTINGWTKEKKKKDGSSNRREAIGYIASASGAPKRARPVTGDEEATIIDRTIDDLYEQTEGAVFGLGNIDLNHRKVVHNSDGSISTEYSLIVGFDDNQVLIPTVIDGKIVSEDEAIDHYLKTGENLGVFKTLETAENYAQRLHNRQDWYYHRK